MENPGWSSTEAPYIRWDIEELLEAVNSFLYRTMIRLIVNRLASLRSLPISTRKPLTRIEDVYHLPKQPSDPSEYPTHRARW